MMRKNSKIIIEDIRQDFENYCKESFFRWKQSPDYDQSLIKYSEYSFFNGGKRFRPLLIFSTLAGLNFPTVSKSFPMAMALEMVHTYSLIHDDLPCMDNDDYRRGQPTSHIKFGQDSALLAGDALLTQAFTLVSESYTPELAVKLIQVLAKGSGMQGMCRGQSIDLSQNLNDFNEHQLLQLHSLKTGALFSIATQAAGLISQAAPKQLQHLDEVGISLGIAFQLKDDQLDFEKYNNINKEALEKLLKFWTTRAQEYSKACLSDPSPVLNIIQKNLIRDF